MVCLSWWVFPIVLGAAVAIGFVACFLWQWWLLSRPDSRPGPGGRR